MKECVNYTLYLCTDEHIAPIYEWPRMVEEAIQGGVTLVQLRMKEASTRDFVKCAEQVKAVTDRYHIPLIINDRLDVAMAIDASGLHVGQEDMSVQEVKRLWGESKLVGVSVHDVEEAIEAVANGADYLGVGAMFATQTKEEASVVTLDVLDDICSHVSCPIVVIGGIKENNMGIFSGHAVSGFAVVSAIMGRNNVKEAAKELYHKACEITGGEKPC